MQSEIQAHADFSQVRYANCWEDADILIQALNPQGRHCLSIGSAGDNSFSLLAAGAEKITISEMNPAQVACIKLRMAAYQTLDHHEFLVLLGEREADDQVDSQTYRLTLYNKCKPLLDEATLAYWKHFQSHIETGYGRVGKFEHYFTTFRKKIIPLVHSGKKVDNLLSPRSPLERENFYHTQWNTLRWRLLFRLFFSRFVMGRLGRDPSFFNYVEGSVADRIMTRVQHALVHLEPSTNPYLHWILKGHYGKHLPHALREENYASIRNNIGRIEIIPQAIEAILASSNTRYDAYNLSDIFEYMSKENTTQLLQTICKASHPKARLAYWNMLALRSRPESMASKLKPLEEFSEQLFLEDKAFFYSKFVIEEVV